MPKTRREIAREVDEILAAGKSRQAPSHAAWTRGEEVLQNIQEEASGAVAAADMADLTTAIPAQRSPVSARALVEQSLHFADRAAGLLERSRGWVREAQGTPQLPRIEKILKHIQNSAARAKKQASATKRAFEERFGKYDPRGVTDQNYQRATKIS